MKTPSPTARWDSLRRMMEARQLDGLVCRLNQNVVMLSGYWPMNGLSLAVLPRVGEPALLIPEQDHRFAEDGFVPDIRAYTWGDTENMDPLAGLTKLAAKLCEDRGLAGKRLGMEFDYPIASLPVWAAEIRQFTQAGLSAIQNAFQGATFVDVWEPLHREASRKTAYEIRKIRLANKLGGIALEAFRRAVKAGRRECDIAADVEHAVHTRGPGTGGVRFARAWATVMSGPNGQFAGQTYNVSTTRKVAKADLVSLELGVVADGYWTDLTRVHCAGKPSAKQKALFDLVARAHDAAATATQVGGRWSETDRAAREVIKEAGHGEFFPHITGHGLGFCYHEIHPLLGPDFDHVVETGQVVTIEPAVYRPGLGGVRHEDAYLVTEKGVENLSPFPRGL